MVLNKDIIQKRKYEHLEIFKNEDVTYGFSSGFENYQLIHNSLPEQDFNEIDISQEFLVYKLDFPFIINSITGGEAKGVVLNSELSDVAKRMNVAFALGSIRPCLENEQLIDDYTLIKNNTPNIPVLANLGGQQLLEYSFTHLETILKAIKVDALIIHLNPIQEILQPEGDRNFIGIKEKIIETANCLSIPVVIKEVGFGLALKNIQELSGSNISWFDISGSGGTSWAKIEKFRNKSEIDKCVAEEFTEIGIKTADLLHEVVELPSANIIASGGINQGLDFAKAIGMGAILVGSAGHILKAWNKNGKNGVIKMLEIFKKTLKIAVFITGCNNLVEYRKIKNIRKVI